jgi:hypothetical protein
MWRRDQGVEEVKANPWREEREKSGRLIFGMIHHEDVVFSFEVPMNPRFLAIW